MILAGADEQIVHAIAVDVAHGHADAAFMTRKWGDRREKPVAVAVIDAHLRGFPWSARHGHSIAGNRRDDVDEHHEPIVFVVQPVTMHHEKTDVVVEPRADRKNAGLDDALVDLHGRGRCVGIVDAELVRAGAQSGRRIVVFGHLEIVDVDVDGMLVIVVIDEPPLFDRIEPRLDQRHVWKCTAVEGIDE